MNPERKKAIVITRFPFESSWGGEEHHTLVLARSFKEKGFRVIFMGSCPVLIKRFQDEGFDTQKTWGGKMIVTPYELMKSFFLFPFIALSLRRTFKKLMSENDLRAVYCLSLNEKLFLSGLVIKNKIPVTWVEHQEIRSWLSKNPWRWLYKKNAIKAKIVPISKKNERTLLADIKIPKDSITFIVNGISNQEIRKYKRKTRRGLIVAANRLIPKKGIKDFINAIAIVGKNNKELEVRILGEGEEREDLQMMIEKNSNLKNASINGFLKKENWMTLLSQTDVYVSCASDSNETFSLNTAEALAAGCKVVVTSCSGIADFLDDKKEAFICNPGESEDIAKKINQALHTSDDMRERARNAAQQKFDQKRMIQEYQSLILRS